MVPDRTRHLAFGDVAAVWAMLERLKLASIVDEVVGSRRSDAGASVGTYLALVVAQPDRGARVRSSGSSIGGSRRRRTGSPRSRPGCWTIAGSGMRWRRCDWSDLVEIERRVAAADDRPSSGWTPRRWRWT